MLNEIQLATFTEELSTRNEFKSVYAKMLKYTQGSVKNLREQENVKEYIADYLRPALFFVEPTQEEVDSLFSAYSTTYGLDFVYSLLPDYVKECLDPQKVVRELFRVYTEERQVFTKLIKQLNSLVDPFETPAEYLAFLAESIGLELQFDLPENSKRTLINRAVPWYKIKGTAKAFQIIFRTLGLNVGVTELWSDYNHTQFSETPDQLPVIDGEANPDYDPTITDDGLIKYKSSFYEISLSPSAANLTSNVISRALEKLEEVRPATRTLKQIKFTMNLTDDENDGSGPGGDGSSGEGEGNGFDTPTDEYNNSGWLGLEDYYRVESTLVTYGGVGCDYLTYGDQRLTYGESGRRFLYNSTLDCVEHEYYYDNGHINSYDGSVLYDNATSIVYSPSNQGLTYKGLGSEVDELEILNISDWEDALTGIKVFYDNVPGSEAINYSGTDTSFTYGGSEVLDELEIRGDISNDFQDTATFEDDIEYLVTTGDEDDQAYDFLSYDGSIYYDNNHSYTYSEENEYLLDELEAQPTGNLEDSVTMSDVMDVMIDMEDTVPTILDDSEEVVFLDRSDDFVETTKYDGLDIDGTPVTYGDNILTYGSRTYSDIQTISADFGDVSDDVVLSDTVDFAQDHIDNANSISDEFGIFHVKDTQDQYTSGLTYNGAINYYGNIIDSELLGINPNNPTGTWDQTNIYDGSFSYDEATPPSYGEVPVVYDGGLLWSDYFTYGEGNIPFYDDLEHDTGASVEDPSDSLLSTDDVAGGIDSEMSDSVSSTDVCDIVHSANYSDGFLSEVDVDNVANFYSNPHNLTYGTAEVFYEGRIPSPESDAGFFDGSIVYYNGRSLKYDATETYYDGYAHTDDVIPLLENDVVDYAEIEMIPTGSSSGTIIKI